MFNKSPEINYRASDKSIPIQSPSNTSLNKK